MKNWVLYIFVFLIFVSTNCFCNAQEVSVNKGFEHQKTNIHPNEKPKFAHHYGHSRHFSKEEMKAKRAEFERRLKLTEEQKSQIKINKEQDREKIKPIIEGIHKNRALYEYVQQDVNIEQQTKEKQLNDLNLEYSTLKMQADGCRRENMNKFESLLTEEQRIEFKKIKEEQKKEIELRKNKVLKK